MTKKGLSPVRILSLMKSQIGFRAYIDRVEVDDPLRVLISIMLSARTKDELTEEVSERLFSKYNSKELCELPVSRIERLIYPVGFYRTKARNIKKLCEVINKEFSGVVPNNIDELLKLPGVGRKTANLFLSVVHSQDRICVDTHVHRISNRLGIVKTKSPVETEKVLERFFPKKLWKEINKVMVPFGKSICKPVRPRCDICKLKHYCKYYKNLKKEPQE